MHMSDAALCGPQVSVWGGVGCCSRCEQRGSKCLCRFPEKQKETASQQTPWSRIKLAAFDVDGTLTDGRLFLDDQGNEGRFWNVRDGAGLAQIKDAGIGVVIITGSNGAGLIQRFIKYGLCDKSHIHTACAGPDDKLARLRWSAKQFNVPLCDCLYMGDDGFDVAALCGAGIACYPRDAHPCVERELKRAKHSHIVEVPRKGGDGAVRWVCDKLLEGK